MKILVTGNQGYIGSVLSPYLSSRGYQVRGLDIGYFAECLLNSVDEPVEQIRKDIRVVESRDVEGVDAVIHLAALSNDPLGELSPEYTKQINYDGTLRLASLAKRAGVRRFVYASSQSMYGVSQKSEELTEDESEKNPITIYARTKWEAECELNKLNSRAFEVVSMRPSTVFGPSPRLRCDIVFNNLLACAHTTGAIEIKSDGTPWRPVIHIEDVCKAFLAAVEAPAEIVSGRAFNVGKVNGNYRVRDLAEAARDAIPNSTVVFTGEHGSDSRTYKVSFDRINSDLKNYFQPDGSLETGARQLIEFFTSVGLTEETFRGPVCNRLVQIKQLITDGRLDDELRRIA